MEKKTDKINIEESIPHSLTKDIDELLIDVERISIGAHQSETIQCFLCFRIPFSPLLINCCEQIICNFCLISWKDKNNECPHCRKSDFDASIPNKFIKRIYADIKYFCKFKEIGCPEKDLSFSQIISHEEKCEYNSERIIECEKCKNRINFKLLSEHDCLLTLLQNNKILKEKIEAMEKENKKLKEKQILVDQERFSFIKELEGQYEYLNHTLKYYLFFKKLFC